MLFILCLVQCQLQIFNIETKSKVKSHLVNEDFVFWKWVSDTTIGLVTDMSVHHWSILDTTCPPLKNFDCHAMLAGSKIINYCMSVNDKWCVLIGISPNTANPQAFKVKGSMKLFSHDCGVSQLIEGHAADRSYGTSSRDSCP